MSIEVQIQPDQHNEPSSQYMHIHYIYTYILHILNYLYLLSEVILQLICISLGIIAI